MSKSVINAQEWKAKNLGEVCDVISRGVSPKYIDDGGICVLNQRCIRGHKVDWTISRRHDESVKSVPSNRLLQFGDGLINSTGTGTLGRVAQILNPLAEPITVDSHITIVRPKPDLFYPQFFGYMLADIEDQLKESGEGCGGQTELARSVVAEKFIVRFPSCLKEQERIVATLDEAFKGIATARANAEKNLKKVRDVLDSELHSLLSKTSNGWKPLTLAEVASDYGRGKSKHRPRNDSRLYGGSYPFVQTGDVRNAEQFITTYSQTYNERGLSQSKLWPKGTLCITIAANIAETAILDFDACFPDSVIGVVADPLKANTRFIEYQLRVAKAQLQAEGKGSAQDNINLGTFETHTFFFPPPRIQEKIVERLDSLALIAASLTEVIEQKVALLDELKQSLLHQAFTGKL
jgi:type I restriction enzyme S subunit